MILEIIKKHPNDADLGRAVRRTFKDDTDSIELLKEVLALHGFGGYDYELGLVSRGELYLETEDGSIRKYKHSCDAEIMEKVDQKIINYLNSLK
jgi:hypothetical protein